MSTKLNAQTDFDYNFENLIGVDKQTHVKINIQFPNGKTEVLLSESDSSINLSKKGFFSEPGNYAIVTIFNSSLIKDSICVDFTIKGNETLVEINVKFKIDNKLLEKDGIWINGDSITKGYLSIIRYYNSIDDVSIEYENVESSDHYKGPFFQLTNNSTDTIFGEHLPGYLWGSLYFGSPDSIWRKS